ncbi:MAG: GNAT family N-acetyltransferase [Actinomycetota bacterium]|nr:GNAT family N-acetyltransferase [Actinomycetota bacterium]
MAIEIRQVLGYEDLSRWVATRDEIGPDVATVEMTALLRATEVEHVDLLALVDGEPAGTAFISGDPRSVESRKPYFEVSVTERHRGKGVGSALLTAVRDHALTLGYVALRCSAREDHPGSVEFLERHGFTVTRRTHELTLRLHASPTPARGAPDDVDIDWLGDRPELLTGMYEVAREAAAHRPDFAAGFVRSETGWRIYELGSPHVRFDLTALALAGSSVRGYAIAQDVPGAETVYHRAMALAPDRQDTGLGEALVAAQIEQARAAGGESLVALPWDTGVERLFQGLGYEPGTPWLELEAPLTR